MGFNSGFKALISSPLWREDQMLADYGFKTNYKFRSIILWYNLLDILNGCWLLAIGSLKWYRLYVHAIKLWLLVPVGLHIVFMPRRRARYADISQWGAICTHSDTCHVFAVLFPPDFSYREYCFFCDVLMSVHLKYISKVQPTRCNVFSIYLFL